MAARTEPRRSGSASPRRHAQLVYLYGVVESVAEAHALLADRQVPGLDPAEPLFGVEAAGLVAAVSYVPTDVFQEHPLNDLIADLPRLTPYAVRHEVAVGALAPRAPAVVPMGFGAVYRDVRRVEEVLRERAPELRALLDRVRNRQEWGLKVAADLERLVAWARAASEELGRLDAALASASPGRAYLLRKQRERLLQAELGRLLDQTLRGVVDHLAGISAAARRDELPAERPVEGPRLVLKAAFLVEVDGVERFRTMAADLARRFEPSGLSLDLTGPWAPYSFVRSGMG